MNNNIQKLGSKVPIMEYEFLQKNKQMSKKFKFLNFSRLLIP